MLARKSNFLFFYIGFNILLLCLMFAQATYQKEIDTLRLQEKSKMVKKLGITDLCLFTDARYTRHPTLADLNTPFQDYPMSFEHFPSGSLIPPPPHLRYHAAD